MTEEAPADYPRQIFHPDGRTARVDDPDAEKAAGEGWSRQPSPVHQQPGGGVSGSVSQAYGPQALMFREILERVLDERGIGKSQQQQAQDNVESQPRGGHRRGRQEEA